MARAYVSIGSNIQPKRFTQLAIDFFQQNFTHVIQSPIYQNPAVGFNGPDFYNLVVGFDTQLSPHELQQQLHAFESKQGKPTDSSSFCSRILDLDLLIYDQLVIHNEQLDLPRNDIVKFAFVLKPLADIAGEETHPILGMSYQDLWQRFQTQQDICLKELN